MQFVVAGGGEVGLSISKTLLKHGHNVVLIEKNISLVKQLNEYLTARIITGDATFFSTLRQINWAKVDGFLAMTQEDAVNILSCQLARILGAKKTLCRIHLTLQKEILGFNYPSHFSLDSTINTQHSCAFAIAKCLRSNHSCFRTVCPGGY